MIDDFAEHLQTALKRPISHSTVDRAAFLNKGKGRAVESASDTPVEDADGSACNCRPKRAAAAADATSALAPQADPSANRLVLYIGPPSLNLTQLMMSNPSIPVCFEPNSTLPEI